MGRARNNVTFLSQEELISRYRATRALFPTSWSQRLPLGEKSEGSGDDEPSRMGGSGAEVAEGPGVGAAAWTTGRGSACGGRPQEGSRGPESAERTGT